MEIVRISDKIRVIFSNSRKLNHLLSLMEMYWRIRINRKIGNIQQIKRKNRRIIIIILERLKGLMRRTMIRRIRHSSSSSSIKVN